MNIEELTGTQPVFVINRSAKDQVVLYMHDKEVRFDCSLSIAYKNCKDAWRLHRELVKYAFPFTTKDKIVMTIDNGNLIFHEIHFDNQWKQKEI